MPMASYCCEHVIVILLHAPSEKCQTGREGERGREEKGRKYSVLVSQFKYLTTALQPGVLSDQEWDPGAESVPRSAELRALQQSNWGPPYFYGGGSWSALMSFSGDLGGLVLTLPHWSHLLLMLIFLARKTYRPEIWLQQQLQSCGSHVLGHYREEQISVLELHP